MANELTKLSDAAAQLRLAELAAFLHNLGKCGEDFIYEWSEENRASPSGPITSERYYEQYAAGIHLKIKELLKKFLEVPKVWETRLEQAETSKTQQAFLAYLKTADRNPFWDIKIKLPSPFDDRDTVKLPDEKLEELRDYRLGYYLEFHKNFDIPRAMFKDVFGETMHAIMVLVQSRHLASGEEKDVLAGVEKLLQAANATYGICAFGREKIKLDASKDQLKKHREAILQKLLAFEPDDSVTENFWQEFIKVVRDPFERALGDTRFPINDVRLWDLSHSTASFFKSAVAGLVCSGKDKSALAVGFHNDLRWRYLTRSLDFFQFAASAQKIIDVVARRDKLEECYAALKKLLEMDYPLANEIYRDEYGPVYLIPAADVLSWDDGNENLRQKILHCFRAPAHPKHAQEEISENIIDALPVFHDQIEAGIEKTPTLQNALEKREPLNTAQPEEVQALLDKLRSQNHFAEVCPVCGLRPVGCDDEAHLNEIAKERKICAVCLSRRSGRARQWRDEKKSHRTIWSEEAADENGRAAVICGRFDLNGWLNGDHIRSIKKNPLLPAFNGVGKPPRLSGKKSRTSTFHKFWATQDSGWSFRRAIFPIPKNWGHFRPVN